MDPGSNKNSISGYNLPVKPVQEVLERIKTDRIIERIWSNDHTVWSDDPGEISNRLGWLNSPVTIADSIETITEFADQTRAAGHTKALLLGMGGSSLAPEVFRKIFGVQSGYLDLDVLDSTDPGAVLEKERNLDLQKTLFIVSTKSGGTVETVSLMKYFYNLTQKNLGKEHAGSHFIAITDPGSGLEKTARELNFRKIYLNDPDIGGRYSALSYFGLVPAGLIGIDLKRLLERAAHMAEKAKTIDLSLPEGNTPAWLGAVLGASGRLGYDKVTLVLSPPVKPFGAWIEQLLAESTGKAGRGLLPVDGETLLGPEAYANDRLFAYFRLNGDTAHDQKIERLKNAGFPVIQLNLPERYALGGEMYRLMIATAVAGWALQINPFDQPNVESAKALARKMANGYREKGELPSLKPDLITDGIKVYGGFGAENLQHLWQEFFRQVQPGEKEKKGRSYIAIQAYLKPDPETDQALQKMRDKIQVKLRMAVTVGYGPRFLHSTGQLHKGDGGNGLFIQFTAAMPEDVPIPDEPGSDQSSISFGLLKTAQALGDHQALLDAGRKVIRFHIEDNIAGTIEKLTAAL